VISLGPDCRLSRVQAHPYAHGGFVAPLVPSQRALRSNCAADRITRSCEGEEERIALSVDLATARAAEMLAEEPARIVQHLAVPVAEVAHQLRRSFDVGEQEGHRARG
jgi:hypothetical protein